MTKKRKTRKTSKSKKSFFAKQKKVLSILIVIIISFFIAYGSIRYYNYYKTLSNENKSTKKSYIDKSMMEKMSKMLENEKKKVDILKKELSKVKNDRTTAKDKNNSIKKIKNSIYSSEYVDYKKSLEKQKKSKNIGNENVNIVTKTHKPMLAIVIDDVSFATEARKIKALPFKVTPSFFPPTKRHPNTPKYAKEFPFYMVHLPMEALHYPHPEPDTLKTTETKEDIEKRLREIKKWFPKDKFINNHTGSKFTSDYNSMKRFYSVITRDGLVFIDSRTSANTVAPKVAKEFHQKLLSRDIFLDNIADITYIKNQLKKAVEISKKRGYAIAIGHPHPKTLQALKESKALLKDVKPVYISTIYANIKYSAK